MLDSSVPVQGFCRVGYDVPLQVHYVPIDKLAVDLIASGCDIEYKGGHPGGNILSALLDS